METETLASTIISFIPMAILYAFASAVALSTGGPRRWGRMNLWLLGAVSAAFMLAFIRWSLPRPGPRSLMYLVGRWTPLCLLGAGIIAALLSFRRNFLERKTRPEDRKEPSFH